MMELFTPSEIENTKTSATIANVNKTLGKGQNGNEKSSQNIKGGIHLPSISRNHLNANSQKNIKLAYSLSGDLNKPKLLQEESFLQKPELASFITKIQNVSMAPLSQRGLIINQKVEASIVQKRVKGRRRVRPPKTHFKIMKTDTNIEKLEKVIVEFIDKNKTLKSSNDEIVMKPQNRMQAAINSLRAVNKILPKTNIVGNTYGYDETNLNKNHLILEKVMLERITKLKIRRQEERSAKTNDQKETGKAAS